MTLVSIYDIRVRYRVTRFFDCSFVGRDSITARNPRGDCRTAGVYFGLKSIQISERLMPSSIKRGNVILRRRRPPFRGGKVFSRRSSRKRGKPYRTLRPAFIGVSFVCIRSSTRGRPNDLFTLTRAIHHNNNVIALLSRV